MEKRKFNPMYLVMNQVQKGKVPASSKVWEKHLSDHNPQPLASWAADEGYLPDDFEYWEIYDENYGHCVAAVAAGAGTLPEDFNRWELPGAAHEAARFGNLPEGFSQWHLADNDGVTVAHVAAEHAHLPVPHFTHWTLADKYGVTVAHVAAKAGYRRAEIPEDLWQIRSNDGDSVEDLMCEYDEFIESCAAEYVARNKKKENT